ncbi:TRAP transporter large permease [Chloroflexota bacterium]
MEHGLAIGILATFGLLFVFLAIGEWVFASLLLAGLIASTFLVGRQEMIAYIPFSAANSWILTAIPMFVLMGTLFLYSGISERLYRGSTAFIGRFTGGLLHANVLATTIFSALSGSAMGCTATVGTVALPELKKRGYDEKLSLCSIAAGGSLGSLIPPSSAFIVFAAMTDTSVGKLFFGGLFPGILCSLLFMSYIFIRVKLNPKLAPLSEKIRPIEMLYAIKDLGPILVIVIAILGGIYMGLFTPTEAAAIGCVMALILSVALRTFSLKMLHQSLLSTIGIVGFIMMIFVGSSVFTNALAMLRIPHQLVQLVLDFQLSPLAILISVCIFYTILGCLIEGIPIMIMTLPIFFPLVVSAGYDPIWFGVITVELMQMGMITPPVGMCLYVIQAIRGKGSLTEIFMSIYPFVLIYLLLVAITTAFPPLATWLPSKMITR